MKIAADLAIFQRLVDSGQTLLTAEALAKDVGAEELLLARVLRMLAAAGTIKEVAPSTFVANKRTHAMAHEMFTTGMNHSFNVNMQVALHAPSALKTNGYKNPTVKSQTPFQYAWDTTDGYFEWIQKRSDVAANFDKYMTTFGFGKKGWVDWYPVQTQLLDGAKPDPSAPLMVDVGGGQGRDLLAFHTAFPSAPGTYILQEQAHVLANTPPLPPNFKKESHDFFIPQPKEAHGSRIYYSHHVMHNWSDDAALVILKHVAAAMEKGYSKLLLNEWILEDEGCGVFEASIDVQMMFVLGGLERTRAQWRTLLDAAGLRVVDFWLPKDKGEGIIEAEL